MFVMLFVNAPFALVLYAEVTVLTEPTCDPAEIVSTICKFPPDRIETVQFDNWPPTGTLESQLSQLSPADKRVGGWYEQMLNSLPLASKYPNPAPNPLAFKPKLLAFNPPK